jgi:hypothetical protein
MATKRKADSLNKMDAYRLRDFTAENLNAQSQILIDIEAFGGRAARGSVRISAWCIYALFIYSAFYRLFSVVFNVARWLVEKS